MVPPFVTAHIYYASHNAFITVRVKLKKEERKLNLLWFCFQHLEQWPKHVPLVCHAEGRTTAAILLLAELADRPVHIAHVARKEEVRSKNSTEWLKK